MKPTKFLPLIALFLTGLWVGGCGKGRYCPAFPDSQLVWLPQLKVGDTVVYSNGSETMTFTVESFKKSKEYIIEPRCKCDCEIFTAMLLEAENFVLYYYVHYLGGKIRSSIISINVRPIGENFAGKKWFFEFFYEVSQEETGVVEKIESITIEGFTYNNVLILENNGQKAYYTKKYGLIRFETDTDTWDLITFN